MELREIASITGKGGLFRIVKPTRSGVIVETLDDKKQRVVVSAHQRVSVLKEISIYTHTAEGSVPLEDVLVKINEEFGDDPGIDKSSSPEELNAFLRHVLPDFDEDRVYASDIKKLVSWYNILHKSAPETLEKKAEVTKAPESTAPETKQVGPSEGKPVKKPSSKAKKPTADKTEAGENKKAAPIKATKAKKENK